MGWQTTVFVTPTLFGLSIALFLSAYALLQIRDGRRGPSVVLFFWITVATVVWTGFSALKLLQTNPEAKLLFFRLLHLGAATLPPLLFLFVAAHTDRTNWLRPEVVALAFALPTVFLGLLFLDPANMVIGEAELISDGTVVLRVSSGPAFLVFSLYSIVLAVSSFVLLLSETRRVGSAYYPQTALIGIALLTPMVFAALTNAGIAPFTDDRINLVPTSSVVSTAALGLLLGRYGLFDLPPLAYTTAMKYAPDALLVLDRDGRIVHANDSGHELLAALDARQGDVLGQHLGEFAPNTASDDLVEIQMHDDQLTYQRLLVNQLDRGGRHVGWVVVFRDETTQQRQQRELQRQNRSLDMFATNVSHDLRNPLNVAAGALEIARDEYDDEALDRVERAHTRMEEIIEQVMVLARSGEQIDEKRPTVLDQTVTQAWNAVDTGSADLSIRTECSVLADQSMLQHIFENLFRNAVEHGGDDVQITVGELADGFFIEDDGQGIPEEDHQEVFEPGYSTAVDGHGFGLQIVQSVAEAHGWTVAVVDSADGGARFEITDVEFVQ